MYNFCIILLLTLSSICWSQGFEQTRLENYMYGPFFNDPVVQNVDEVDVNAYFKGKRCKTKQLNKLHQSFFSPGLWTEGISDKEQDTVMVCAWLGQSKGQDLLDKLVYAKQLKQQSTNANRQIRQLLYDPVFILKIAKNYPKILKVIPDSHPDYLNMAIDIIREHPSAFNDVTLRFKRHPRLTQMLFNIKPSYDDVYKHLAIQYALNDAERKSYIMHNGLLYLELPIEARHNPYLAYHAFIQNDFIYPFIPKPVIQVFKTEGAIMTPRYMTKVAMIRQQIGRKIQAFITPITSVFSGSDTLDDVVVTVEDNDAPATPEPTISFETIDFKNERTVVTDIRIINKIENKKKRRLLNLWRISRFGDNGQVFVAMFRPNGKDNLGAIVVKQNERIMFSDYAAVFSMDGESIWRVNDEGSFSSKTFVLDKVVKSSEGYLNFSFSWKGKYTTNQFNLIDQSGLLIKEFINYYFE